MTRESDRPRVFMVPDYTGSNPYQTGLIGGIEAAGVAVHPIDANRLFPLLSAWREKGRPDAVHIHWAHRFIDTDRRGSTIIAALLSIRTLIEVLVLRVFGIPVVWTIHNVLSHERRAPRVELAYRHLLARSVQAMIVHCEAAGDRVLETYRLPDRIATDITAIPHGNYDPFYDRSLTQAEARARLDLSEEVPVLLFFGMIRSYKRVPTLIDRFGRITAEEAQLLVVGNPWNERLRREVATAAAEHANVRTVLEYVPDEDVETYLTAADAIVLPYDGILTSGSAILGMTFGRAVIAPERGCLPSLLGSHGGITYDPDTGDGLSASLATAITDRTRLRSMGKRNRRVADRLDWTEIGARTAHVYISAAE